MTAPAVTVTPLTLVKEAARLMAERRISGLPVIDETGTLLGIVTEADLMRLETVPDPRAQSAPPASRTAPRLVGDVMTRDVVTCDADTDLGICVQRMLEAGIKRVPVLRDGRVVGVLSRHDVMKVIARDDEQIRLDLEALLREDGMGDFEVRVQQGHVEITGRDDPVAARLAESLAQRVPGVLAARYLPRAD